MMTDRPKPIIRSTDETAGDFRALAAELAGLRRGRRVTQNDLLAALVAFGRDRKAELLPYLDPK